MVWRQEKTISLKDGMMPRKMQLSFRLKKMNKVPSRLKSVQLDITSTWSYSTRAVPEKKKILEEEFGVAMNEELEREVLVMCNLSQGVKAEGREEGINIGEMRMLVKQVRKGRVTIEEAAEDAGMTVEEFKKVMENTPLQAV